ncbi:methyltransferase domain-containing protein [Kitasatospora sp. NPDC085879]|uniref:class I SAM-dependent methyltransferase n=1 Tax=Kitasatospora sp. NPDC085879 TaxID=3154769 RepID=UPI00342DFCB8
MAYAFDPSRAAELERVQGIEATWDTCTIGLLESLGPGQGGSFLEVGAGAGSIARWAVGRVGASGEVVATDLDTRFLQNLPPGVTVLRHDIRTDPLPADRYDLVHARLVLSHLPERDAALATAAAACRPGGVVLIEEFDESDTFGGSLHRPRVNSAEAEAILLRAWPAVGVFVASLGYDATYGHRLADSLADCGLTDVTVTRTVAVLRGATPQARAYRNSVAHLGLRMIEHGFLSAERLDPVLTLLDDPGFSMATPVLVSAMGRRPVQADSARRAGRRFMGTAAGPG